LANRQQPLFRADEKSTRRLRALKTEVVGTDGISFSSTHEIELSTHCLPARAEVQQPCPWQQFSASG